MIEYATKITALYSRLSVGDEDKDGSESGSIVNQKAFLERYARRRNPMTEKQETQTNEERAIHRKPDGILTKKINGKTFVTEIYFDKKKQGYLSR